MMSSCIINAFSGRSGAFYDFIYQPARCCLLGMGRLPYSLGTSVFADENCAAVEVTALLASR